MKPQLLAFQKTDGAHDAWLVDGHSIFVRDVDGQARTHYASAVAIGACRAGQIAVAPPDATGAMVIVNPMPCVLCVHRPLKEIGLEARGIRREAAAVLLRLAASVQNVQAPLSGTQQWTFGDIVKRSDDPEVLSGGTIQKMLATWKWSRWHQEGLTGAQRHADMVAIGYRGSEHSLRQMLSDLGLVATKKR